MIFLKIIILKTFILRFILSQEVPIEYKIADSVKFNYDLGKNWHTNSSLDQIRYASISKDSVYNISNVMMNSDVGFFYGNSFYYIYLNNRINFKKNFFLNAKFRATNSGAQILGYTGLPRTKQRLGGFESGEYENASVGYQNEWLLFQLGRGKQSWGAGEDINVILTEYSPSYDHMLIGFNILDYKFRYFHGFLESIGHSRPINRYIVGRAIEKTNFKNLIFSFSEIIIYQGENRPLDFSMISPVGLHAEIELNNRQNYQGNNQNAVWQFSLDYHWKNRLRISGNYLIDELTIDEEEIKQGESNLTGLSAKISYLIGNYWNFEILADLVVEKVGTYTLKHTYGMNNFVSRGLTLGNINGSDFIKHTFNLRFYRNIKTNLILSYSKLLYGENNINMDPYSPYDNIIKTDFPSGINRISYKMSSIFKYWINDFCNLQTSYDINSGHSSSKELKFSLFYYHSFKKF